MELIVIAAYTSRRFFFPVVVLMCTACWLINPDAWIADDSYFYLVIARNIARDGIATFSGIVPTNGFHPLWGWLLGFWAKGLNLLSQSWLLTPRFGVPLSSFCLLLAACTYRRFTSLLDLPALPFVLPLVFTAYFGVLFSEGHMSLLALTVLCLHVTATRRRPTLCNWIVLGFISALTVLARLDNLFVVGSVLIFAMWSTRPEAGNKSLVAPGVFLLLIFFYMVCNNTLYGGYMPVSGWMKSSFPTISIQGLQGGANPSFAGVPLIWGWGSMALSMLICFNIRGYSRQLLSALLLGLIAKNAYIVLFTRSHTGWYWYSTLDLFVVGFALSAWAGQHLAAVNYLKFPLIGITVISIAAMLFKALTWNMPQDSRAIRGLSLIMANTSAGDTILVSDWPGYVAFYAEDRHIVAADMLTANRRWYGEMRQNKNALDFIRTSCRTAGKPLTHILWNGNKWLKVSADMQTIDFNDPRLYPVESKIGEIRFHSGPVATMEDSILWKL